MRLLALPIHSGGSASIRGGFLLHMRAWLTVATPTVAARLPSTKWQGVVGPLRGSVGDEASLEVTAPASGDTVVAFPQNAFTRFVHLARELKQPFLDIGLKDYHPLILRVDGGSHPRLYIDSSAYAEFRGIETGYTAVFNDAFDARITVETANFDAVAYLVRAYITSKLADSRCDEDRA